ncbi:ComF family protein [Thermohalobacter berrensis]|uniref:Phosphoribosyltransferase n=1 Tax=Thermohalobacter berrensis TaxID=99594 RepID=A0A419T438_9FIRM|nr:ComF family protein [Thermohalobacter berrensis]RKD32324.1 phosphoribosyltransferase [Thermohalobacter berrensis]
MRLIKSTVKTFFSVILELIYPERGICFICDKYDETLDEGHICKSCRKTLPFIKEHRCKICGKPLELGYIPDKCPDCIKNRHYFEKAVSPLLYKDIVKDYIYKYKYGKKSYMYKAFAPLMVNELVKNNLTDFDLIVPVPLHRSKMRKRGFNQSELLARLISKKLDIPLDIKNLKRVKKTLTQNKLKRDERYKNVKNAFSIKKKGVFNNKRILLVDDIFTTGSTVDECSKTLLKAGGKEVFVVTIAVVDHY